MSFKNFEIEISFKENISNTEKFVYLKKKEAHCKTRVFTWLEQMVHWQLFGLGWLFLKSRIAIGTVRAWFAQISLYKRTVQFNETVHTIHTIHCAHGYTHTIIRTGQKRKTTGGRIHGTNIESFKYIIQCKRDNPSPKFSCKTRIKRVKCRTGIQNASTRCLHIFLGQHYLLHAG